MSTWQPRSTAPFELFALEHDRISRFLHATEHAYRLATDAACKVDPSLPLRSLFPKTSRLRRLDSLKRYISRERTPETRPPAKVQDFLKDLSDSWDHLYEAVVVQEVGVFELYLREWSWCAASVELEHPPRGASPERLECLNSLRKRLSSAVRSRSLTLNEFVDHFPRVGLELQKSPHWRTRVPSFEEAAPGLSAFDVTQMWREVRNLIIHHDRLVHQDFLNGPGKVWQQMEAEAIHTGKRLVERPLHLGKKLPLVLRHVLFCLTTIYQAAVVLYLAWPGGFEGREVTLK